MTVGAARQIVVEVRQAATPRTARSVSVVPLATVGKFAVVRQGATSRNPTAPQSSV